MTRSRLPRRTVLAALCLFPVIALCAWKILPADQADAATVPVTRGDIESSVTALGTLQPRSYVDVGSQASGQIMK
ncbi:MAG: secretion protein HlyD, partial [Pseudomonas sp.]|nr:secretion protein HlyD [Pseudomonas sp.]